MRALPIAPADMDPRLRALHDDMAAVVAKHLEGFVSTRPDGALAGPFPPLLRFPQFGAPAWDFTKALIHHSTLPKRAHEVAVLATGAAFDSRYELYAHERVAEGTGLSAAVIATIAAGGRPADLTEEEAAAYDVAFALCAGRQLPQSTYARAVKAFGEEGTGELVFLVGGYRDHRLDWMIRSGGRSVVAAGIRDRNIRFSWPDAEG